MPWFFYKSGFFSKPSGGGRTRHYLKKYIRPFIIYGLIGWLVQGLILCLGEGESVLVWLRLSLKGLLLHGSVYGNGALWFLMTLFFVRLFSDFILHKVHPIVVALVCLSVATAHFYFADSHTPWYLGNFFSGLCFFSLGNYFRKYEQNKWVIVVSAVVYFSFVMLYLTGKMDYAPFYFHKNTISKGNYLLFYPFALSGIVVINNLFRKSYDYWKFPVLSYIGRNAMNFYVTHWIVLVVAQFAFSYQLKFQSPKYLCLLYVLSCIVVLPIISCLINLILVHDKNFKKSKKTEKSGVFLVKTLA